MNYVGCVEGICATRSILSLSKINFNHIHHVFHKGAFIRAFSLTR